MQVANSTLKVLELEEADDPRPLLGGRCAAAPRRFRRYGGSFDMMIVADAANMPPTPWQTEIRAPGIWAGAVPRW